MTQKNRTVLSTRFTLSGSHKKGFSLVEYYVEARPHARWVRVDGPFTNEADAEAAAIAYSKAHPATRVRVVLEQS
ncbi:MAG: hypothetical protein U0X40_01845 [Ferruginibacter sp.]